MSDLNIYQRINAVMKKVEYVKKDSTVKVSATGGYKAVSHDNVTALVRKHMVEQGIALTVNQTSAVFDDREVIGNTPVKGRMYNGCYDICFVNIDKPSDKITISVNAQALDNGDKAPGKAMSYATKYAILKTFMIETGESDESRSFDPSLEPISASELLELQELMKDADRTPENLLEFLNKQGANVEKIEQMNDAWFKYAKSLLLKTAGNKNADSKS